VAIKFVAV